MPFGWLDNHHFSWTQSSCTNCYNENWVPRGKADFIYSSSSHLKPDSRAMLLVTGLVVTNQYDGYFLILCLEKQIPVLPSCCLGKGRKIPLSQPHTQKKKIVSEYLNLLMENPESCWKGKGKSLCIPQVKGMFRLSLILVLPSVLQVQTERKSQNYSESKTQFFSIIPICPQLELCSLCFECILAFLSPIRNILYIKIYQFI